MQSACANWQVPNTRDPLIVGKIIVLFNEVLHTGYSQGQLMIYCFLWKSFITLYMEIAYSHDNCGEQLCWHCGAAYWIYPWTAHDLFFCWQAHDLVSSSLKDIYDFMYTSTNQHWISAIKKSPCMQMESWTHEVKRRMENSKTKHCRVWSVWSTQRALEHPSKHRQEVKMIFPCWSRKIMPVLAAPSVFSLTQPGSGGLHRLLGTSRATEDFSIRVFIIYATSCIPLLSFVIRSNAITLLGAC